jgi:hypothetical protein
MNPVTRRLLDDIDDPELAEFALAWDAFEEMVVRIYRAGGCSPEEADAFAGRRRSIQQALDRWDRELDPYWEHRSTAEPESPFREILRVEHAEGIVGNWDLLRLLPPTREALNGLLIDRGRA